MVDYQELLSSVSDEYLRSLVQESHLVFIGSVISVGKPPRDWAGFGGAYQTVTYKVEKILKGETTESEISIVHSVVFGALTAQEGDTPGLSPELFAPKSKLIISAQRTQSGFWKSLAENYGALPATSDWQRKIESALK